MEHLARACPDRDCVGADLEVTVTCNQHPLPVDGCRYLDRFVSFVATVRKPGEQAVRARGGAEVVYRFDFDGDPEIEVHAWTPTADETIPTTTLPPCASPPSTTTTVVGTTTMVAGPTTTTTTTAAPTTTTSSTTTTSPVVLMSAPWQSTAPESVNGNKWRATGTVTVTSQAGGAVDGASVTVGVERSLDGATWTSDGTLPTGATTSTGSVTFHSASYNTTGGQAVKAVRFTIKAVAFGSATWGAAAYPTAVVVLKS